METNIIKNKKIKICYMFMIIILLLTIFTSCYNNTKNDFDKSFKDTFVNIKTYFDVTDSRTKHINKQNFIIHLQCPNSWHCINGVYDNNDELSMIVHGIIKKVNKNLKLDNTAYKYTYRNNDGYNFKDKEYVKGINKKNNPYVLYKNLNSFSGYVIFKFYDEYITSIEIGDCPNKETMYKIINSVYLEICK